MGVRLIWYGCPPASMGVSTPTVEYNSPPMTGGHKRSSFLKIGLFSQKIAIISITILASSIAKQPNDSPGSPLSICALRLAVSLIL